MTRHSRTPRYSWLYVSSASAMRTQHASPARQYTLTCRCQSHCVCSGSRALAGSRACSCAQTSLQAREPARARDPLHTQWDWQRQVRVYWRAGDACCVRIADAELTYSHEYLGVRECLVITALTDRCYLTLSQALSMHVGGAPIGPAGTGKTETIFRGLAQAGAWGSFDEFNRLELPVLSVVAAQVGCVLAALKQRRPSLVFTDGTRNLRSMFRFMSMMVPERREIIKTKLAAAGYKDNDALARKVDALYRIAEGQLSARRHYDFGLRAVLSVLRAAGPALRRAAAGADRPALSRGRSVGAAPRRLSLGDAGSLVAATSLAHSAAPAHPAASGLHSVASLARRKSAVNAQQGEEEVLMQVLCDLNVPKLVHDDVGPFMDLIADLFPQRKPAQGDA
eukprot:gene18416-63414_t